MWQQRLSSSSSWFTRSGSADEGKVVTLIPTAETQSNARDMIFGHEPSPLLATSTQHDYGTNNDGNGDGDPNSIHGITSRVCLPSSSSSSLSPFSAKIVTDASILTTSTPTPTDDDEAQSKSLVSSHDDDGDHGKFDNPPRLFESDAAWDAGTASVGNEIINLLKNIVGSGGLSLPAGIAAFGNAPSAIVPAVVAIVLMGLLNAYSFSLLGKICAFTKSKSYSQAWDRTVGRRYGPHYNAYVDWVVSGKAILGTWSFSIIIASTCQPLAQLVEAYLFRMGRHEGGGGDDDGSGGQEVATVGAVSKSQILVFITVVILLPLCILERLGSLAFFSMIGQVGTMITVLTMTLRYLDGTYLPGGRFYDDLLEAHRPKFGNDGALAFFSPQSLVLISILSTGYVAHYNAPKYYFELKDHTTARFNVVVNSSFLLAAFTYVAVSSLGFLTFGAHSAGFILDNYSYRDPLATLARFGVALSVTFAYPLLFHGGRDSLLATFGRHDPSPWEVRSITVLLLGVVTVLALSVNDLTFVLSFSGATMSSLIIYIFPPLMFGVYVGTGNSGSPDGTDREVRESVAMMVVGGILGVCGAVVTIVRAFS